MTEAAQTVRLMDPTMKGRVLCAFKTVTSNYKLVLAEALAKLHPAWGQLSNMECFLDVWDAEEGAWIPYL